MSSKFHITTVLTESKESTCIVIALGAFAGSLRPDESRSLHIALFCGVPHSLASRHQWSLNMEPCNDGIVIRTRMQLDGVAQQIDLTRDEAEQLRSSLADATHRVEWHLTKLTLAPVIRRAFRTCDEDEAGDDAFVREIEKRENEHLREAVLRLVFVDAYGLMPEADEDVEFIEDGSAPTQEPDFLVED